MSFPILSNGTVFCTLNPSSATSAALVIHFEKFSSCARKRSKFTFSPLVLALAEREMPRKTMYANNLCDSNNPNSDLMAMQRLADPRSHSQWSAGIHGFQHCLSRRNSSLTRSNTGKKAQFYCCGGRSCQRCHRSPPLHFVKRGYKAE